MAEEARIHCPYHSPKWRSVSQCIINQMRGNKLLNSNQIRRIPSVVCACPDKAIPLIELPSLPEKEKILKWTDSLISDSYLSKIHSSVQRFVKASNANAIPDSYKQALNKMLAVIYLVCHNNKEFLDPLPRPNSHESTEQFHYKEEDFLLSIPVIPITYIGNLIGKEGTYLKALCSKYNVESVHLGENSPAEAVDQGKRRREIYIHSGPIKVTYKFKEGDSDKAMRFRKALEERAQEVEKKRQRQYEIVKRYQAMRFKRAQEWRNKRNVQNYESADLLDSKHSVSLGEQKHKNKDKNKQKVKPPPVLEESKCLHCQQPHSTETKECTYHPGYIIEVKRKGKVTKRWTCCDKYYRRYQNLVMEHARTGCTVDLHIWRPVKNTKRKSKPATNNKDQTEDVTVAQKKT